MKDTLAYKNYFSIKAYNQSDDPVKEDGTGGDDDDGGKAGGG
ncbi:hypothetical protein [Gracilimonas sp.]